LLADARARFGASRRTSPPAKRGSRADASCSAPRTARAPTDRPTAPAPTAWLGAVTSPLISASGPTSTGPRLLSVAFTLPRTINPPQTMRSATTLPRFSTVTMPTVSTERRAA
jgi:hypothetical protein